MFCNNCGTKLEDVARFCPNCGNPVAGPVQAPNDVQPVQEPVENPYAPVQPVQKPVENPYAPIQPVQETVENPYAPVQPVQEPVENPYAPIQPIQATQSNTFNTPVQPGTDGQQWSPLMQPEKKSKKGLIIGLCAGAAVIIVAIVVVCILIFNSDNKSDKDDSKGSGTDNKQETTTAPEVNDEPVDVSTAAGLLMTEYFEAIEANDMDAYKNVWLAEVFDELVEYYPEDNYSDEEIIQYTSEVDTDFGVVQKAEVSDIEVTDYSDSFISEYYIEEYGLQDGSIEKGAEIDGVVKLTSDTREASFDFDMDLGIVNGEWKILYLYIDLYSFTDYDYTFSGTGDDEFKQWYDFDSEEPSEEDVNDPDDLTGADISGFVIANAGSDSIDTLAEDAFKAFLAHDYDASIKTLVPAMGTYFNYFVDSGLLTKDDVIEELLSDYITTTANFKSYDYESVDLSSSELQEYNDVIKEYEVGDECDKGMTITGTLTYEVGGTENEITAQLVVLKSGNKWYVADVFIDGTIE